jgi:hypothetical protein
MAGDAGPSERERLSGRDKVVAVVIALVLIAIILAIFRLGIANLVK